MSRYDSDLDYQDWLNDEHGEPRASERVQVCYQHNCVKPCEQCADRLVQEDGIEMARRLRRPVMS